MLYSASLRSAALALLLGLGACSLDLNERPNATNDATASAVPAATLQEVRWELVELDGQPATAAAQTPYLVLQGGRARAEGGPAATSFRAPTPWPKPAACAWGPWSRPAASAPTNPPKSAFYRPSTKPSATASLAACCASTPPIP
ncbi:META domain-containing protein [Hymenobacter cellulosilyticus]|uniref:META domain-containing protein n=1 Tax=Hymenobacter cellulosilyticus TaxID=2932248 RepID=A0A8T9Q619_9BACT|nr:META domain-containing protein [Hymenobacter cellulosilyticus]UOQ71428.1 META domain-containing protein [Hymenobacter cellulosilyticus]